ncbi:two-partner secretion domain-containing protein [Entomobacter blattae]|uniref:Hemagglutination activity domain protein n=1 Tax=Entomobacter blattae TaxID=2762277 RepID=A0A7H1NNN9_9PROT|nr:filamentous hemagglutinin N-terminal domain-containing protein [Entomobacter blattae]QNT77399.1 hemagglutination activity domain protein [Entomobacter blattae]
MVRKKSHSFIRPSSLSVFYRRKKLRRFLSHAVSLSYFLFSTNVMAQQAPPSITVDTQTAPQVPAPTLETTANGIPQVNIATPNQAGVSHNMFTDYNVGDKGVVLNNATHSTKTESAGYVTANGNLQGKSANVILNEVTGKQASQLGGYTEVAGQKAAVVIANPNGINCNGCGFINTDRATLSTGHPEFEANGQLGSLTVTGGQVTFSGKGGDFTTVPVLDVISRSVKLDAHVNAQTVNIIAGRNRYDYQKNTAQSLGKGDNAPSFAIDSTAFGGLYANRISMLVNEQGAGVRVAGQMAANAGDLTLNANGDLIIASSGSAHASGAIQVTAGGVNNAGSLQAGGNTTITAARTLTNSGVIQSVNARTTVQTAQITNTAQGHIQSDGSDGVTLNADNSISNEGQIGASKGSISITTARLDNGAQAIIGAEGGINAAASAGINNQGMLSVRNGAITLQAGPIFDNQGGKVLVHAGRVSVTAQSIRNHNAVHPASTPEQPASVDQGQIEAGDTLVLNGDSLTNEGGLITANKTLNVSIAKAINNDNGILYGATDSIVTAQGALSSHFGQIGTSNAGNLTLTAATVDNGSGKIIAGQGLTLQTAQLANGSGLIQGGNGLKLFVNNLNNAQGNLLTTAGDISIAALAASAPESAVPVSVVNDNGVIQSANNVYVQASTLSNNQGSVTGAGDLSLSASTSLVNDQGKIISQQGSIGLYRGDVTNAGGAVSAAQDITALVQSLDNSQKGVMVAQRQLNLFGDKGINNNAGGILYGDQGGRLSSLGQITNVLGQIGAGSGILAFAGAELDNRSGKITSSAGALDLSVAGINNDSRTTGSASASAGLIQANGLVSLNTASLKIVVQQSFPRQAMSFLTPNK